MSISGLAGYGRPYPTWPDLAQTISGLAGSGPDHIWLEMAQTISEPFQARPDMVWTRSGQTGFGLGHIRPGRIWSVHIRPNSASWPEGLEKSPFLEGFCQFFVLFFAFSLTICMYKAFFAKKIGPFDLLWPLERPLQSSATYRGLPLPAMSTYKYKRHSRAIC